MLLPRETKKLAKFAREIVDICTASMNQRGAAYRQYAQWIETGRQTGGLALANYLYSHVDRLHSHLFSPSDLRFSVDFENHYPVEVLYQADMVSRVLTREWERRNIDTTFALGVREALSYGCCLVKLLVNGDSQSTIDLSARLVMPWNFGVYNENVTDLADQEAVAETVYMTKHELWRRIAHLPDAENLYRRVISGANKSQSSANSGFFHQVLSTAQLDTNLDSLTSNIPGGLVQLTADPNYTILGPQVGAELYAMHELWVKDDERNDYVTVQLVEPDILICPLYARKNLFCPQTLPYGVIRANEVANYFWGRSEIVDLMMLQQLLTTTLDDTKRIMGQQFDLLLAFSGDGLTDEKYAAFRSQGWTNLGQNGTVHNLTPKLPQETFTYINMLRQMMEEVGGFGNILSGRGDAGVRSGNYAETLMKTASPRLRDRALLIERDCADFAEVTLSVLEAKNAKAYWTSEDKSESGEFLLSQVPDDRRVSIDSHSTSPIYQDDHQQLIAFGIKAGFLGGDTAIEQLPYKDKDILKNRFKKIEETKLKAAQMEAQKQEQIAEIKAGHGHK